MANTPRDSQRAKLYRAESVITHQSAIPDAWCFDTIEAVELYVTRIVNSAWFQRRWPSIQKIRVGDGRGRRRACAIPSWPPMIKMPMWSRNRPVVLHEVAHCCAEHAYGRDRIPAHGWQFARTYAELVTWALGKPAGDALKRAFKQHRVRYSKPRELSPHDRQRAAARIRAQGRGSNPS